MSTLDFKTLKVGTKYFDKGANMEVKIIESSDIHNVRVEYTSESGPYINLICFDENCDSYDDDIVHLKKG